MYDAGDNMKTGFPYAASATMLSWGFIEYRAGYAAAGQDGYFLRMLSWFTDYLLKCHVAPNVLYVQVGDVTADHNNWGPPETMTEPRPAYQVCARCFVVCLSAHAIVVHWCCGGVLAFVVSHATACYAHRLWIVLTRFPQ